jgi:hypothetical protein
MPYGWHDNDGHTGLNVNVIDQKQSENGAFTLTLLETNDGKWYVLHANPSSTFSLSNRVNAATLLSWLGFSEFQKCQHFGRCYYKVLGPLEGGFNPTIQQIQANELRRASAARWAEHFDEILRHAISLETSLQQVGMSIPGLK